MLDIANATWAKRAVWAPSIVEYYIVYGGWRHCNVAKLNADFTGFVPLPDGSTFKEITPADELRFDEHGLILPVKITKEGVAVDPIRR